MPPTMVQVQTEELPRDTRMTLVKDEYLSEYPPYRFRAGTVILVDRVTAERWRRRNIGVDSAETDKTAAELKRAELERLRSEIEALESGEALGDLGIPVTPETRTIKRAGRRG